MSIVNIQIENMWNILLKPTKSLNEKKSNKKSSQLTTSNFYYKKNKLPKFAHKINSNNQSYISNYMNCKGTKINSVKSNSIRNGINRTFMTNTSSNKGKTSSYMNQK